VNTVERTPFIPYLHIIPREAATIYNTSADGVLIIPLEGKLTTGSGIKK
jgi:hypothetical protein